MNELSAAEKWIKARLTADSATTAVVAQRIFSDGQAPEKTARPFIVYTVQAARDTPGLGTVRLLAQPVFQIKVVCDGAPNANVRAVADRIDELFQKAVNAVADGFVFSSRRVQPLKYSEPKPNSSEFWTHFGGLYRISIHPVSLS